MVQMFAKKLCMLCKNVCRPTSCSICISIASKKWICKVYDKSISSSARSLAYKSGKNGSKNWLPFRNGISCWRR